MIVQLSAAQLAQLADLVADRLGGDEKSLARAAAPKSLVGAAELAVRLGCSRRWVYDHAQELGAVRLGTGSKAPLRFDLEAPNSAMARLFGEGSQAENARNNGAFEAQGSRRPRRLPDRLPKPGLVLAVGGSRPADMGLGESGQEAA